MNWFGNISNNTGALCSCGNDWSLGNWYNEWSNVSVTDATMGFMAAHTHSGVDVQVWLLSPSSSPVMLVLKSRSQLREWGWGYWEKGGWENLRRKPLDVARKWGDWGSFPGIGLGDWLFGKSINQEWGGWGAWGNELSVTYRLWGACGTSKQKCRALCGKATSDWRWALKSVCKAEITLSLRQTLHGGLDWMLLLSAGQQTLSLSSLRGWNRTRWRSCV